MGDVTKEMTREEMDLAIEERRRYNREIQRRFRQRHGQRLDYWLKRAKDRKTSEKAGVGDD